MDSVSSICIICELDINILRQIYCGPLSMTMMNDTNLTFGQTGYYKLRINPCEFHLVPSPMGK
jgi:hypothetical protein